jgi:hypothetical protein
MIFIFIFKTQSTLAGRLEPQSTNPFSSTVQYTVHIYTSIRLCQCFVDDQIIDSTPVLAMVR